jgi:ABC-type glycerol-3-phosphate transport system permease component
MSDLLKGLSSGGWGGLFAWIFPNAAVIAFFWIVVYSPLSSLPFDGELGSLPLAQLCVVLFAASAIVGVIASASSTPLYRILEGYLWPAFLCEARKKVQRKRKEALEKRVEAAPARTWERGLLLEKLARFPLESGQVVPTRLGNAIRAFETYGKSRFNLDSQTLWSELVAVAPKSLQTELDRSRSIVDFFVASVYATFVAGCLAIAAAVHEAYAIKDFMFAGVAFVASWSSYKMAIISCSYWKSTVQALVNLGRCELAKSLGLQLPATINDEQIMWGNVTKHVYFGEREYAENLDRFRKASE